MEENLNQIEQTEQKVVKVSKLQLLRDRLGEETGYTKNELADLTGLKLSTVNCQIYHHLPNKGKGVIKMENGKYRFEETTKVD